MRKMLLCLSSLFTLFSCSNKNVAPKTAEDLPLFLQNGEYTSVMSDEMRNTLRNIRHVSLDMDGTIYLGGTLFPYTVPFLENLGTMGINYCFLTNNPTKSLDDYIAKLRKLGVPCGDGQMYSTTAATIDYIKAHYPEAKRLFLLGTPSMISQFEAAGFISCADDPNDRPDVVVAAFDPTLTYSRLCRCTWWASHKEIPYVATNPDWVCPTDEPTILVDCGSLCACIAAACGRKPDTVIGKPSPDILLGIMEKNGVTPAQAAMVGDRLYTDVKSGLNAGACGVLVLTGETTLETALASVPEDRATIICRDIAQFGDLLEEVRK